MLQNEVAFSTAFYQKPDEKKKVYLDEFLKGGPYGTNPEYPFKILRFTVLDMDGDKIPEVVLALAINNRDYADFYEVLHYYNGEVYGYHFGIRSLGGLKTDGTFHSSGGAGNISYNKIRFSTTSFEVDKLGYSRSRSGDIKYGSPISFFINNESVTDKSWDLFNTEQHGKENVVWYEFLQENVEKQLSRK